jgi:C4-dicarboxylate-specific signal transduction histidine kinase
MEPLALTISLNELAQIAVLLSGATSATIEVKWPGDGPDSGSGGGPDGENEISERVVFKQLQDPDARYEQFFESGNCRISLRFLSDIGSLNSLQRRGLDLVASQVIRQVEAKRVALEQQRKVTQTAKMSALGEMASGIAHEINNPLAIIQGHLNKVRTLVENDILDSATLLESLQVSSKTVSRLGKIVEGLRNFARDGAGDPFQKAELFQVVNETLGLCQERFNNHNIKLNVPSISRSLVLECRQVELCQVLLNLLTNAFDAVVDRPDRWVDLKFADRGTEIEIRISDSGKPIPREISQKMFQPFFTTKLIGKGTGLGLSISKGIVEAHQGSLRHEQKQSEGRPTEFVILIPKVQRPR